MKPKKDVQDKSRDQGSVENKGLRPGETKRPDPAKKESENGKG